MQDHNDPLHAYKGEARRLSKALLELNFTVTHSQSLDLVGRVHGHRDWKELAGLTLTRAQQGLSDEAAEKAKNEETAYELDYLESWLRAHGVTETELDMLVHDYAGTHEASDINNSGMFAQLDHLLEHAAGGSVERLRELINDDSDIGEPLNWTLPGLRAQAWDATGYEVEFDVLPWLVQGADAELLEELIATSSRTHLGNCDAGDNIAAWTLEHGLEQDRIELSKLYERIRASQLLDPDAVGITVSIERGPLRALLEARFEHRVSVKLVAALDEKYPLR